MGEGGPSTSFFAKGARRGRMPEQHQRKEETGHFNICCPRLCPDEGRDFCKNGVCLARPLLISIFFSVLSGA